MPLDVVAVVSVALGGAAMLLQTLFTSRCSHIECCSENGCLSCERVVDKDKNMSSNNNNNNVKVTNQ